MEICTVLLCIIRCFLFISFLFFRAQHGLIDQLFTMIFASHLLCRLWRYNLRRSQYITACHSACHKFIPGLQCASLNYDESCCKSRIRSKMHNMTWWENPNKAGVLVYKHIHVLYDQRFEDVGLVLFDHFVPDLVPTLLVVITLQGGLSTRFWSVAGRICSFSHKSMSDDGQWCRTRVWRTGVHSVLEIVSLRHRKTSYIIVFFQHYDNSLG